MMNRSKPKVDYNNIGQHGFECYFHNCIVVQDKAYSIKYKNKWFGMFADPFAALLFCKSVFLNFTNNSRPSSKTTELRKLGDYIKQIMSDVGFIDEETTPPKIKEFISEKFKYSFLPGDFNYRSLEEYKKTYAEPLFGLMDYKLIFNTLEEQFNSNSKTKDNRKRKREVKDKLESYNGLLEENAKLKQMVKTSQPYFYLLSCFANGELDKEKQFTIVCLSDTTNIDYSLTKNLISNHHHKLYFNDVYYHMAVSSIINKHENVMLRELKNHGLIHINDTYMKRCVFFYFETEEDVFEVVPENYHQLIKDALSK